MSLISISCPDTLYQKLNLREIIIQDFLQSLINKNDSDNAVDNAFAVIERILREYHFNDGGSPYIEGFEISNAEYNTETKRGKIWLRYRIDYYFGCEDRSAGTAFNESYNFVIDTEALLLTINFPEPAQRDTLEEF